MREYSVTSPNSNPALHRIPVWDPFVRVFHWTVASCFLANYFIIEEGGAIHEWVGYVVFGLVVCRIVWGFTGSRNARFSSFLPTPGRINNHFQQMRTRQFDAAEGHNPLGGMMVLFLLIMLVLLGITGYLMENIDYFWGEEWLEELHSAIADITMFAVVVHVSAVICMQKFTGIELIKPMITGSRRHPPGND